MALLPVLVAPRPSAAFQGAKLPLPPDFSPPRTIPKLFQIEDERITGEKFDNWNKTERTKYQEALRSRSLDGNIEGKTVRKRITDGIQMRVLRFSLKSQRPHLKKLRKEIEVDLDFNARDAAIRKFALDQIVEQSRLLLSGNFHVRLHIVLLVGNLNLEKEKIGVGAKPAIAYTGGAPLLLSVVSETLDGKPVPQSEAIKILAVHGLKRILNHGTFPRQATEKNRIRISESLLQELQQTTDGNYELALMHALANAGIPLIADPSGTPRPQIVTALARVMVDPKRSLRNRCRAAHLLGITPIPSGVQAAPIAWGIAQLASQIATQYGKRIPPTHAIFYFQDLYLALTPPKGKSTSDGKQRAGLRSTLKSPSIEKTYEAIRPIMAFFVTTLIGKTPKPPATIPESMTQKFSEFKKPASMSIQADAPPIDQKQNRSPEERSGPPAG
ncbi:MAG: hypothetical protein VB858_14255 [Planctomycetaceae bacterium]